MTDLETVHRLKLVVDNTRLERLPAQASRAERMTCLALFLAVPWVVYGVWLMVCAVFSIG